MPYPDQSSAERNTTQFASERLYRSIGTLLLTSTLMLGTMFGKQEISADSAIAQGSPVAHTSDTTPQNLAARADSLVTSVAEAWTSHQRADGNFLDPVQGRGGGYGVTMIGQALVETGVAESNETFVQDGIQAEVYDAQHPTGGGFEAFGLTDAYNWNQAHLATDPAWQSAAGEIASFLDTLDGPTTSPSTEACLGNPHCWSNKKLVAAFGNLELTNTELTNSSTTSVLGKTATLHADRSLLLQAASQTGKDARFAGTEMRFGDAGILSDPTKNPLAYHELSTMMLGRVVETLGPSKTSRAVQTAFQRSARAIVGLMAPDGDGAYIGRGQGQVWNVAAEVDALSLAARYSSDPTWRGRFLAGAERALNRLETTYTPGSWGMPLTPRLLNDREPNYSGIDEYATTVEYNGLALWALQDAVTQLRQTGPAPNEGIGSDADGVFVDPSHTKFAAVRKGDLWWAIHAGDTAPDARYDFGLVAGERITNGMWKPAIPYRPFTNTKTSGGPVLIVHGEHLVPVGDKITATAAGVVNVEGGWAERPGGQPVTRNVKWIFKPEANGVNMSFHSPGSHTYGFQTWYEEGSDVTATAKSLSVSEPNGRHESYTFNRPVTITDGPVYHSAYDENLGSSMLTIYTKPGNDKVSYTTTF